MSRTIQEIYNEMIAQKQNMAALKSLEPNIDSAQSLLSQLTTPSKVALWRLLFFVVSVGIWVHEQLFDIHKQEIEQRAKELITGTARWYRDQCFIFQYGDALQWVSNKYTYANKDVSKQTIKRAAVEEIGGQVRIKVAKLGANDLPAPLDTAELTAFKAYIGKIKFAGTNIAIISRNADLLKISYDIKYDPLVLNSSGQLIADTSVNPVEAAINGYIQNLPFNGVLNLTKLTDVVQNVPGVVDPVLNSAHAKYGGLPYKPIAKQYNANAGHMVIDSNHPLTLNLTYHV